MANTKVTANVLADDAVTIGKIHTQSNTGGAFVNQDPSDGHALVAKALTDGYYLSWESVGVSGISSSADATAITITSAEKVGIGVTSPQEFLSISSQGTGSTFIQVTNSTLGTADNAGLYLGIQSDEDGYVGTRSNQPLNFATNNTERMTIAASGTVGIGTTPSVHMFTVSTATSGILAANFVNTNTGGYGVNISAGSGTNYVLRAENYAGGTLWQINADGNMCHGFTDDVDGANYSVYSNNSNGIAIGSGSGSNQYRRIYHAASDGILRFKSSSNTPYLSNAGAWTNASDRAYKENIEDIEYGLDTVEALQPRKFDMIDDGSHEIGFIEIGRAHV